MAIRVLSKSDVVVNYESLPVGPSMKERSWRWFVFVLVIALVAGEKSDSKDDEDENYELRNNEVDDTDDATKRMLELINNAAMHIVDAPDLSKVILQISLQFIHCFNFIKSYRKNLLINLKSN